MEPELPTPRMGQEQAPVQYGQSFEHAPAPSTPEQGIERGAERQEQASESQARAADDTPVLPPPVMPVAYDTTASNTTLSSVSDTPIIANDDDLIEKEWVDKAKRIITETKDDPYRREEAVVKLQADYLQKRYGRKIGAADESWWKLGRDDG